MGYKVGWDLSGMGYKVGWLRQIPLKWTNTCSMNMGQVQFILNLNILSWGPYKIPFVFLPPPFERLSFGMDCFLKGGQPNWFLVILLAWTSWD